MLLSKNWFDLSTACNYMHWSKLSLWANYYLCDFTLEVDISYQMFY